MSVYLFAIHHQAHGLAVVENVASRMSGISKKLLNTKLINGAIALTTCNRSEIYIDAPSTLTVEVLNEAVEEAVGAKFDWLVSTSAEVIKHLFAVTAGLDSMVIGEREIVNQVRKSLKQALTDQTSTGFLTETFQWALKISRQVANQTSLAAHGKSLVNMGLDLWGGDFTQSKILVIGTGDYATVAIRNLKLRGAQKIYVYSKNGRATDFAQRHKILAMKDLALGLQNADLVVSCRGLGDYVVQPEIVAATVSEVKPLTIIDLALAPDVNPEVEKVPGVTLYPLSRLGDYQPQQDNEAVNKAREIVSRGAAEYLEITAGRKIAPAVIAYRSLINDFVEEEIKRMANRPEIDLAESQHALRRLAAKLAHTPSIRAREAAANGESEKFLEALAYVYGIDIDM